MQKIVVCLTGVDDQVTKVVHLSRSQEVIHNLKICISLHWCTDSNTYSAINSIQTINQQNEAWLQICFPKLYNLLTLYIIIKIVFDILRIPVFILRI